MKKVVVVLLFLCLNGLAFPQIIEIGAMAGGSFYIGDLNPAPRFSLIQPAFGGVFRYNFDPRWALKASLLSGKLQGADSLSNAYEGRQLNFQSPLTEISTQIELSFLDYFTGSSRDGFSPYLFGGVALFLFNPQADYNGQLVDLQPLKTEGQDTKAYPDRKPYSTVSVSFPFGLGFKYSLGKKVCVGAEWGMRKTLTDYIDDVSTTYYLDGSTIDPGNLAEILSDPGMDHQPGMQRGNSRSNDWYSIAGVFLTYRFSLYKAPKCNQFNNVSKEY